jgi:hypothetical protein
MDRPTVTEIRTWSKVPFDELGYPVPEGSDPDALEEIVARMAAWLEGTIGYFFEPVPTSTDAGTDYTPAAPPARKEPLIRQALQLATEFYIYSTLPESIEGVADFDVVQSFNADGYSETRRGMHAGAGPDILHPWPKLNDLLNDIRNPELGGGIGSDFPVVGGYEYPVRWDVGRNIMLARGWPYYDPFDMRDGGIYIGASGKMLGWG